jgi:hypothetical protein
MSRSLHARQLGPQAADLHAICSALTTLLSTPVSLPARCASTQLKIVLVHHAQCACRRRDALATFDQPHGLLLDRLNSSV